MNERFLANMENIDYALQIAALGWAVFPCKADKTPLISKAEGGNGYHDATTDIDKIYTWWAAHPGALVGIACQPSGLIVFDLDRHPGEPDGVEIYTAMAAEAGQPITELGPCQTTPGNGVHFIFKAPRAGANFDVPGKLAPGVDIRYRGYICTGALPDGRAYQWQAGHHFDTRLTYPPKWIARALIAHNAARQAPPPARQARAGHLSGQLSPADLFAATTTWSEILPAGWHRSGTVGDTEYWTRPGKRAGVSATVNFSGKENLYVFSTNASPFEPNKSYTKFGAFTLLNYNGDYKAAVADLKNRTGKK